MREYIEAFRGMTRGFIVDTCEGDGTPESPSRIVHWVHDEDGNLIGEIDPYKLSQLGKLQNPSN